MGLRCLELMKESKARVKSQAQSSKWVETRLERELSDLLKDSLSDATAMEIEVPLKVLPEFLDILDGDISRLYDYRQESPTLFIFYNKTLSI